MDTEKSRLELPERRKGTRMPVPFVHPNGETSHHIVTFNVGDGNRVVECFFARDGETESKGGQLCELLEDGCKLLSRCLQRGDTIKELAAYCGESIPEGCREGPPSSIIGAIARTGAELEKALQS